MNSTLNVVLTEQGDLYLNGDRTDHQRLAAHVANAAWKEKELQAVISADTRVDYGQVVRLIDLVKTNGVKTFALDLKREM